jgi:hypothetical protein
MSMSVTYDRIAEEQDRLWTLLHDARQHCEETGHTICVHIDASKVRVHVETSKGYSVASIKERSEVYGNVVKELIDALERAAKEVQP